MKIMRKALSIILLSVCALTMSAQEDLDAKYGADLLKPGSVAPAIMADVDGKQVDLIEKNKGKYVVLEFWASWCGDCRRDMKKVREIHNELCSDSVMIQGYSFDKDAAAYEKCRKDSALCWPCAMSPVPMRESPVAEAYHLHWIPSYYLIDKQGRVVLATVVIDKIREALKSLSPALSPSGEKE